LGNQVSSAVVRATASTTTKDVMCAIVVTYNPGSGLLSHLATLRSQVGEIIVVDNNSSPAVLDALRWAPPELNITLIKCWLGPAKVRRPRTLKEWRFLTFIKIFPKKSFSFDGTGENKF